MKDSYSFHSDISSLKESKDTLQKDFAEIKQKAKKDKEDAAAAPADADAISDEAVSSALAEIQDKKDAKM